MASFPHGVPAVFAFVLAVAAASAASLSACAYSPDGVFITVPREGARDGGGGTAPFSGDASTPTGGGTTGGATSAGTAGGTTGGRTTGGGATTGGATTGGATTGGATSGGATTGGGTTGSGTTGGGTTGGGSGSLVLHVKFDGGAPEDVTGNHPATDFSILNVVATTDRFGNAGKGGKFSRPALVQIQPNLLPTGNAPRTLTAWVKPRVSAPTPTSPPNSNVFVHYGIDDCTSKMFGLGHLSNNGFGWTGCKDVNSTLPIAVGAWTFVAQTYDGAGTLTLTVDYQRVSVSGATLATPANTPLAIGGERKTYGQGFVYYLDGEIDEVRAYDYALSPAELDVLAAAR